MNGNQKNITHLYRYMPLNMYTMEIFSHRELYFTSPKAFNDPFDCKAFFTYKNCDTSDLSAFIEHLYKLSHKEPLSEGSIKELEAIKNDVLKNKQSIDSFLKEKKEQFINDNSELGIICLSENVGDILMWSHYADSHKGFCIEFDKQLLDRIVMCPPFDGYCKPIQYTNTYPSIKEFSGKIPAKGLDDIFLLRKSKHWKYEREWRIIVDPTRRADDPKDRRKYDLPEYMLSSIIFGSEMPEKHIDTIQLLLKDWKSIPNLFRAEKKGHKYAIGFKQL